MPRKRARLADRARRRGGEGDPIIELIVLLVYIAIVVALVYFGVSVVRGLKESRRNQEEIIALLKERRGGEGPRR